MKNKKDLRCPKCGSAYENENQAAHCSGCGADFVLADRRPLRSYAWLLAILFSGFLVMIPATFSWIALYGHGIGYILIFIGLGLGVVGAAAGRLYEGPNWLTALVISLPYVYLIGSFLNQAISFKHNYATYGIYWSREFYLVPALAYVSPLCWAYLGTRFGAKGSITCAASAAVLLILLMLGVSTVGSRRGTVSSEDISFRLLESNDIQLWADIKCQYTKKRAYWEFRNLDRKGCGGLTITEGRKNQAISLPTTAYWIVDGAEIASRIMPVDISREHFHSSPPGFNKNVGWRTDLPFERAEGAQVVEFRWGDISIDFTDPNSNHMKLLEDALERLKSEPH